MTWAGGSQAGRNLAGNRLNPEIISPILELAVEAPEFRYNERLKRFEVIFASRIDGNDTDIYFSFYDETANSWSYPFALTVNDNDDNNPRFAIDKFGSRYVAWESSESFSHVYITRTAPQSNSWEAPLMITGEYENAYHPTLTLTSDDVLVFYRVQSDIQATGNGPNSSIHVWSAQEDIPAW